jgi:hypothetical protein
VLDDAAIERYARQIIVPGIGAAGQEKLLRSTVLVIGHPRGCATASLYLRAAGVNVVSERGHADVIVVADTRAIDFPAHARVMASSAPACWYTIVDGAFVAGIHPDCPLPLPEAPATGSGDSPIHDAAACDAASTACAILIGIDRGSGAIRFEVC